MFGFVMSCTDDGSHFAIFWVCLGKAAHFLLNGMEGDLTDDILGLTLEADGEEARSPTSKKNDPLWAAAELAPTVGYI